jgi:hypothetical protein
MSQNETTPYDGPVRAKSVIAYFFSEKRLSYGDDRKVVEGDTHTVKEKFVDPCSGGLHASPTPAQALGYKSSLLAPGNTMLVSKVKLSGKIIAHRGNKYAAEKREYLKVVVLTQAQKDKLSAMRGRPSMVANINRMIENLLK